MILTAWPFWKSSLELIELSSIRGYSKLELLPLFLNFDIISGVGRFDFM